MWAVDCVDCGLMKLIENSAGREMSTSVWRSIDLAKGPERDGGGSDECKVGREVPQGRRTGGGGGW